MILGIAMALLSGLASGEETVNLQWSICGDSPEAVLKELGSTDDKEKSEITYFDKDVPEYLLNGVFLRSKEHHDEIESEVKIESSAHGDQGAGAECGYERYGHVETYRCALKSQPTSGDHALWSLDEMKLAASRDSVAWDKLVAYGPYKNPKWEVHVEQWKGVFDSVNADGLNLMELEVEAPRSQADAAFDQVSKALAKKGINLCDRQEGKMFRLFRAKGLIHAPELP